MTAPYEPPRKVSRSRAHRRAGTGGEMGDHIRYDPSAVRTFPVSVAELGERPPLEPDAGWYHASLCRDCGALVWHTVIHGQWHAREEHP